MHIYTGTFHLYQKKIHKTYKDQNEEIPSPYKRSTTVKIIKNKFGTTSMYCTGTYYSTLVCHYVPNHVLLVTIEYKVNSLQSAVLANIFGPARRLQAKSAQKFYVSLFSIVMSKYMIRP